MTDHAPLTDKELAEMERRSDLFVDSLLRRAVADLRAKNQRIKELEEEVRYLKKTIDRTFWGIGW